MRGAPAGQTDARRTLRLYWITVAICLVLLAWWAYFFSRQGAVLVERIEATGHALEPEMERAVRAAADHTLRMFVFEGGFLGLLLIASVALVVRSLRREIAVNRQQRNFVSAVTHELRSPLASALLYLESIALGRAQGEKAERYLRHAQEDLERLRGLVDQILETARLSERRPELLLEDVELGSFVRAKLEQLAREHVTAGADVRLEAQDGVVLRADVQALDKILRNLVSNAVKYGGEHPAIAIAVRAEGGQGLLEVRDFGPGLGESDSQAIFEPFVRGGDEDVRRRPGVGLGLFLVAELVRAHGGRVRATDQLEGGGTALSVALPLAHGSARP